MEFFGFNQPSMHRRPQAYFEMLRAFPASFFGKTEVEKGNMSTR